MLTSYQHRLTLAAVAAVVVAAITVNHRPTVVQKVVSARSEGSVSIHFYGDIDASGSAREQLRSFIHKMTRLLRTLNSDDQETLMRTDNDTQPFADRPASGSSQQIHKMLSAQLAPISKRPNTYTQVMWRDLTKTIGSDRKKSIFVFETDGHTEGLSAHDHELIRGIAKDLAMNPYLSGVAIIGVRSAAWKQVASDLQPLKDALGSKFIILSDTDKDITPVTQLIEAAQKGL